jgi:phosphoribosylamine--glycine ligase
MNVLLIGSGGREHALAWAISKSPLLSQLFCAPGNPGIAEVADCIALDIADHARVVEFCIYSRIALVVVGPEGPLVGGLVDALAGAGIKAFGPTRAAARLEGSKGFTKDLCKEFAIPTGAYGRFGDVAAAKAYLARQELPIVVKADGLAAGKGVVVAATRAEAVKAIDACFAGAFGAAGREIVIEEFLEGEEASIFTLVDGENALLLPTAQDYKRAGDGDTGLNTGGMGAYSPAPVMSPEMTERTLRQIIRPTIAAMRQRATPFQGVLYLGVMITKEGPKLYEYNVRFGDPECQALIMRLKSDLLAALLATAEAALKGFEMAWDDDAAVVVVMAAKGYPGAYAQNTPIRGLEAAAGVGGVEIFHAGTRREGKRLLAAGGRVLNVAARGRSIAEAQQRAYAAIAKIDWPDGFCRSDIAWRALAREDGSGERDRP